VPGTHNAYRRTTPDDGTAHATDRRPASQPGDPERYASAWSIGVLAGVVRRDAARKAEIGRMTLARASFRFHADIDRFSVCDMHGGDAGTARGPSGLRRQAIESEHEDPRRRPEEGWRDGHHERGDDGQPGRYSPCHTGNDCEAQPSDHYEQVADFRSVVALFVADPESGIAGRAPNRVGDLIGADHLEHDADRNHREGDRQGRAGPLTTLNKSLVHVSSRPMGDEDLGENGEPLWLDQIVNPFANRLDRLYRFGSFARSMMSEAKDLHRLGEAVDKFTGRQSKLDADDRRRMDLHLEIATEERDEGFPTLGASEAVFYWATLETLVWDIALGALEADRSLLQGERFMKVKLPVADFLQRDERGQLAWLLAEAERALAVDVKAGASRFEGLLALVNLGGPVREETSKGLYELHKIRNLVAHRAGRVDARFQAGVRG
jgi:hypothetical protein